MSDTPVPSRLIPIISIVLAVIGSIVTMGGFVLTTGMWRGQVDVKIEEIDKRLSAAEQNQKTYIPVLVGMQHDISYLADRARDTDRQDKAHH